MKGILTDAVAVANAIARVNLYASRDPKTRIYTDRQWWTPFVGGSYQFLDGAERLLDARMMFFYYATGITPAMTESKPDTGSAYAITVRDATGSYLDPNRTYKVTLPGPIPAKNFWSFTAYDNQTRADREGFFSREGKNHASGSQSAHDQLLRSARSHCRAHAHEQIHSDVEPRRR